MLNLDQSVENLVGIGPKMAGKLERLGIEIVRDLIFYYPRTWMDFSKFTKISSLRINESYIIKAKINSIEPIRSQKKWMSIIHAELEDVTGKVQVIWFNQPYLLNILKVGDEWLLSGKVGWDFKNKNKTLEPSQMEKDEIILPVYPLTEGLTQKFLRKIIKPQLARLSNSELEFLPDEVLKHENLVDLKTALQNIHFPQSAKDLHTAKKRLAFDELFLTALRFLSVKKELQQNLAPAMQIDEELLKNFVKSLPYKLTNAQRKSAWEIIKDLNRKVPMNRLLEGDVGSGKTVVAAMAALVASNNKYQTVWLAPTEILTNQHFQNICKLFKNYPIKIGLITSSKKQFNNPAIKQYNSCDLLIGTHALIQKNITIPKLGLIIIDEQHRFGVKQRSYLRNKPIPTSKVGRFSGLVPHFLSMTATPIPRTLALALYGDLDISIIDELPKERQQIITKVIEPKDRNTTYKFIEKEIKLGRQAFVVCPLIEETENSKINLFDTDRKSAVAEFEKLSKYVFPSLRIGLIHGKLKSKEKDVVMTNFKNRRLDVLVSTAVIEVGIDIPNATVMMIESADRFGLAQLHQFRGRVGRGKEQSYCFLFSDSDSAKTKERLNAMRRSNNGFELAQADLEQRGPGELIGLAQSGLEDLKMAKLTDTINLSKARSAAEKIIKSGLEKYPKLCAKLKAFETEKHLE
jgi:ATP-dependent DNA helicase RecG